MGIAPSGQCGLTSMASYPVKKSPTQCDQFNTCPSGNTCCCVLGLSDRCLFWGCCPLKDAVCCKDHQTCCAEGTVCDPNGPGCLSKRTNLKSGSGARASTYQRGSSFRGRAEDGACGELSSALRDRGALKAVWYI